MDTVMSIAFPLGMMILFVGMVATHFAYTRAIRPPPIPGRPRLPYWVPWDPADRAAYDAVARQRMVRANRLAHAGRFVLLAELASLGGLFGLIQLGFTDPAPWIPALEALAFVLVGLFLGIGSTLWTIWMNRRGNPDPFWAPLLYPLATTRDSWVNCVRCGRSFHHLRFNLGAYAVVPPVADQPVAIYCPRCYRRHCRETGQVPDGIPILVPLR